MNQNPALSPPVTRRLHHLRKRSELRTRPQAYVIDMAVYTSVLLEVKHKPLSETPVGKLTIDDFFCFVRCNQDLIIDENGGVLNPDG